MKFLSFLRGYCTPVQKLAHFVFYLQLSILSWKIMYAAYSKLSKELKNDIKIKVGQAVLKLLIKKTRGGYSTLVWVGVCRWDFWNATHPCTHFEGKVTHPCTKNQNFSLKFAPFWRKFRKILKSWPIKVPNLRHFGANFRKFWKIDPSKYHVFEKKRDPLMDLAAWFCYPCLRHIPITTFVLSTPPPGKKHCFWLFDP